MRKIVTAVAAALALLGLAAVATADPQPLGPVGSGVSPMDVVVVDAPATMQTANDGTVPVPTNENGEPMYLSQDGGDGEHASIAVGQGLRDLIQSGNYDVWELQTGETNLSNESQTVYWLKAGDTYFRVTVAPDPTVAPEGTP